MQTSRRDFCKLAATVPLLFASNDTLQAEEVGNCPVFHFYGAEDCPPCMAFKRDGLPKVRQAAEEHAFGVAVNIIKRTRDVPVPGSYSEADPLLRRAVETLPRTYPPIFFVTDGDDVLSVWEGKWQEALAFAIHRAQSKV